MLQASVRLLGVMLPGYGKLSVKVRATLRPARMEARGLLLRPAPPGEKGGGMVAERWLTGPQRQVP